MKNKLVVLGTVLIAMAGIFAGLAVGKPPNPPGQDPCSHGNTGKPCRPDPQPNHGKDCLHHGKKGGVNEDHCLGTTSNTTTNGTTTNSTTGTTSTQTVTVTVPVTGPSTTTTNTVTVTTPSKPTVKVIRKKVTVGIHTNVASHHNPKSTG